MIGSGIMAERLAGGNVAVALIANTGATVAVLMVLIGMLGPVSGAHFNPGGVPGRSDTRQPVQRRRRGVRWGAAGRSVACSARCWRMQCSSCRWCKHPPMCGPAPASGLSEIVATGGLVMVVMSCSSPAVAAPRVAAWIGAAYWFTASTSFANPAITLRSGASATRSRAFDRRMRRDSLPHSSLASARRAVSGEVAAREPLARQDVVDARRQRVG